MIYLLPFRLIHFEISSGKAYEANSSFVIKFDIYYIFYELIDFLNRKLRTNSKQRTHFQNPQDQT